MGTVNFKKRSVAGKCDAQRCTKEPVHVIEHNGKSRKLCEKHAHKLTDGNIPPPPADPPAPGETQVVEPPAADGPLDSATIQAAIVPIHEEAKSTLARLPQVVIQNQQMLDIAGQLLQKIKGDAKRLDEQRKTATKPMFDAKKTVDSWFKPALDTLKECEDQLKAAIVNYTEEQERIRVEALERGDHETAIAHSDPVLPEGVQTRRTWKFEITDYDAIPREFLAVDVAKIQSYVTEHKDKASIPGVRAYLDTGIAAGSK